MCVDLDYPHFRFAHKFVGKDPAGGKILVEVVYPQLRSPEWTEVIDFDGKQGQLAGVRELAYSQDVELKPDFAGSRRARATSRCASPRSRPATPVSVASTTCSSIRECAASRSLSAQPERATPLAPAPLTSGPAGFYRSSPDGTRPEPARAGADRRSAQAPRRDAHRKRTPRRSRGQRRLRARRSSPCSLLFPPAAESWHPLAFIACLVALIVASRAEFDMGSGFTVPIQLAFVPLLFTLPPSLAPSAVAFALMIAYLPDVVRGKLRPIRLVRLLGSAWFSVGPAVVLSAADVASPTEAAPLILVARARRPDPLRLRRLRRPGTALAREHAAGATPRSLGVRSRRRAHPGRAARRLARRRAALGTAGRRATARGARNLRP